MAGRVRTWAISRNPRASPCLNGGFPKSHARVKGRWAHPRPQFSEQPHISRKSGHGCSRGLELMRPSS